MKQNILLKTFVLLIAMLAGGISASWGQNYTWTFDAYCTNNNIESGKNANISKSATTVVSTSNSVDLSYVTGNNSESRIYNLSSAVTVGDVEYNSYLYMGGGGCSYPNSGNLRYFYTGTIKGKGKLTIVYAGTAGGTCYIYNESTANKTDDAIATLTPTANSAVSTSQIDLGSEGKQLYICHEAKCYIYAIIWEGSTMDESPFELTSSTDVELWEGETSQIKGTDNLGTVTYESNGTEVATVSETGLITAVAKGTTTITVTDPGDATHSAKVLTVNVTVKKHENTETGYIADGSGTVILTNDNFNEELSNSALGTGNKLTYGNGPLLTLTDGNNNNFQNGSYSWKMGAEGTESYKTFKVPNNSTITLEAGAGVTITSAKVYVMSNDNDNVGELTDPNDESVKIEVPTRIRENGVDMTDATKVAVYDFTETKTFKVNRQCIVVIEVAYTTTQQMILEIKETGYATLYTDYAVAIPEGVEAFTGKYNEETQTVQLSAVTGTIPANTAVILHTETPGTYSFVKADDVDAIDNNDLRGTLVEMPVAAQSVYTLGLGGANNTVGMRLYNGTTIRAYSAYMVIPTATIAPTAPFLSIGFGEEGTTGIRSIDNGQLTIDNVYYDLAGRRVAQPSKGVYIVNGKKVVIK